MIETLIETQQISHLFNVEANCATLAFTASQVSGRELDEGAES
jgi:hypothetical protein